ncbi:hypothetical protein BGM19_26695 [Streptomyces agglomeratus]|uniref:hypothetical protein n=1 Tax=Streptomyces agglomeratus TaxID=285458 RepID=UPI00086BADE1|nr:hypothetical protein [Streptomyces agglomeratus]OEJ61065.1 hypothetical protein BGM19_26695 [Streptomyces agglomeratus]
MSGNSRRRESEGNPRSGRRATDRRAEGHLRERVARDFSDAAERGLDGVPIAQEARPAYHQFIITGFDELMAQADVEAQLPVATGRLERFTGDLANETRRRSLAEVTLVVFTTIKDRTCPLWPFC